MTFNSFMASASEGKVSNQDGWSHLSFSVNENQSNPVAKVKEVYSESVGENTFYFFSTTYLNFKGEIVDEKGTTYLGYIGYTVFWVSKNAISIANEVTETGVVASPFIRTLQAHLVENGDSPFATDKEFANDPTGGNMITSFIPFSTSPTKGSLIKKESWKDVSKRISDSKQEAYKIADKYLNSSRKGDDQVGPGGEGLIFRSTPALNIQIYYKYRVPFTMRYYNELSKGIKPLNAWGSSYYKNITWDATY